MRYVEVLRTSVESQQFRSLVAAWPVRARRSHRQALAPLGPSRPYDSATSFGRHPLAKPVGLRSFANIWLIGTLHCTSFLALHVDSAARISQGPRHSEQGIPVHGRREQGPASSRHSGSRLYWHGVPFRAR
jgi:hypothetical protein